MYARLDQAYRAQMTYFFPRVEQVGQTWVDSFRRTLGRFSVLYLAELDGQVLGFVLGRVKRVAPYLGGVLVGEISEVWVEPPLRRRGVARELVQRANAWLYAQGVHSVEAQVLSGNQASLDFFRSLGFQVELQQVRLLAQAPPVARPFTAGTPINPPQSEEGQDRA